LHKDKQKGQLKAWWQDADVCTQSLGKQKEDDLMKVTSMPRKAGECKGGAENNMANPG
jgi:hypothetical protein